MSVAENSTLDSVSDPSYLGQEFQYRPIPLLVPISLGFVFLSLTAGLMAELLVVPLVGAILAAVAYRQIRASRGGLGGGWLAFFGICSQAVLLVLFAGVHVYSYATEVPEGYQRVSFLTDISKKGFVTQDNMMSLHPDVVKLLDQKVMIKGYMYPDRTMDRDLTKFVLCRDNGDCCFGGQPKPNDMIQVYINPGVTAHFRTGLVFVAGTLRAHPNSDGSIYQLECDHFGPAKSQY